MFGVRLTKYQQIHPDIPPAAQQIFIFLFIFFVFHFCLHIFWSPYCTFTAQSSFHSASCEVSDKTALLKIRDIVTNLINKQLAVTRENHGYVLLCKINLWL